MKKTKQTQTQFNAITTIKDLLFFCFIEENEGGKRKKVV